MEAFAASVEGWGIAEFLRRSIWAYPLVNWLHVIAIGVLVTSASLMDLRVLGFGKAVATETVIGLLRPVNIHNPHRLLRNRAALGADLGEETCID